MKKSRRHALGQHFLKNPQILEKITKHISLKKTDLVIEIGAGDGSLTRWLTQKDCQIIAIEKDPRLIHELKQRKLPQVTIVAQDVLSVDFKNLTSGKIAKMVGNLPYAITTPLMHKVLAEREVVSECHFLVQKETVDKMCAVPGSKKFSPLSLLLQNHFEISQQFRLSPGSFSPPPKVHSAFVSLIKKDKPLFVLDDEDWFQEFIYGAFSHRRKTIVNNLKRSNLTLDDIKDALKHCDIPENARPEQIPLAQFVQLYKQLKGVASQYSTIL